MTVQIAEISNRITPAARQQSAYFLCPGIKRSFAILFGIINIKVKLTPWYAVSAFRLRERLTAADPVRRQTREPQAQNTAAERRMK